jgi:hypothetical protein
MIDGRVQPGGGHRVKRDIELIRKVMLAAEKTEDPNELIDPKFDGHSETEVSYHIALLDDAGLLHGQDRSAIGVFRWSAGTLTWAGHEFVEAVRDDGVWQEALAITAKSGSGVVFDVLTKALIKVLEQRAGLARKSA